MANTNKNIKINLDYSDFSGGITECNRKMTLLTEQFKLQSAQLGNNASEIEQLHLKESTLTQKVQLQNQVMQQSLEKWDQLANSEEASIAQIEKAHIAYQKQATKLQELQNELNNTRDRIEDLGNAEDKYSENTNNAGESVNNFSNTLMNVVSTASAVSAALGAIESAFDGLASATTRYADDLNTMSSVTSLSTDTLQELQYASKFVDVSLETMTGSMTKMVREMQNASEGSASAKAKFEALGLSVTDANGHLKSSEQMFLEVVDALGGIRNETERDAAAMDLFGKSAQQLNPLIEAGSRALRGYMAEAEEMGYVVGQDSLNAWQEAQNAIDKFNMKLETSERTMASAFVPIIKVVMEGLAELPTPVLAVIGTVQSMTSLLSAIVPVITMVNTSRMASVVALQAETAAETEKVAVDGMATASALALDAALLPQIITATLLTAALIALVAAIYMIIEALTDEADAADKATSSTNNLLSTAQNIGSGAITAGATSYMASGGTSKGGLTWVGEQGAELVDLPRGATVYNHEESKSMMSSTNNYYVTIDAKNVTDFNRVVNIFSGLNQSMNKGSLVNG